MEIPLVQNHKYKVISRPRSIAIIDRPSMSMSVEDLGTENGVQVGEYNM